MFKRSIALMMVLMLVLGAFAGCSKPAEPAEEEPAAEEQATDDSMDDATDDSMDDAEEEPAKEVEQVMYWNIGADPKTLDPGLNGAVDGGHVINNTFEGLMREVEGNLEPAMAESYEVSEDGLTYTFHMREDAKWSDGKPVTANDFEYAWNRVLDPVTASEYSWIYGEANLDTFEAKDEKTFVVTLKAPTPWFLGLTTFYTFFPVREDMVAAKEEGLWAKDGELAISNGPFKLTEYENGEKLVLEKNENYWRADEVKLEKIVGRMIVDVSTALTAYRSGEFDILDDVPTAEVPGLIAEEPTFHIFPALGTYYYSFNLDVEPLDNLDVRRALTLAIDRKAIVETVTKAGQLPASTMIPDSLKDAEGNQFNEMTGDYGITPTADVETAKKLLADAGYPNGEGFPKLELMYNTNEGHQKVAEAIQEMWKTNLGIDVTLTNQEWAVFQDSRKQGAFEIARGGWIGDYRDPLTFLGMYRSDSPQNYGDWVSEEYDQLIADSMTAPGQERFEMLFKADKLLMEDAVILPIYYYTESKMISNDVKGWELNAKNTWYFGRVEMVN